MTMTGSNPIDSNVSNDEEAVAQLIAGHGYRDLRSQPVRSLYLLYQVTSTLLIRIPFWAISYIPKSNRPWKTWSLRRSVAVRALAHIVDHVEARAGPLSYDPNHLAIASGQEGVTALWIPAVPSSLITGKLKAWADDASVSPVRIPGYWTFQKAPKAGKGGARGTPKHPFSPTSPALPGEKVVYFLHGGAYVMLSAHSSHMQPLISGVLHSLPRVSRLLALEYRLSSTTPYVAASPFPAALIDALSGYVYLVHTLGFEPKNILIAGDSAGGNLALALVRYLVETGSGVPPPPGDMLLLSPWCDLTASNEVGGPRSYADFLAAHESRFARYARAAFLGPVQLRARGAELNAYISPACLRLGAEEVRFVGFPRTMVVAGEAERLRGQIETLVERMVRDLGREEKGGRVSYYVAAGAAHDFLVFSGFQPEGRDTLAAIAEWFDGSGGET